MEMEIPSEEPVLSNISEETLLADCDSKQFVLFVLLVLCYVLCYVMLCY